MADKADAATRVQAALNRCGLEHVKVIELEEGKVRLEAKGIERDEQALALAIARTTTSVKSASFHQGS